MSKHSLAAVPTLAYLKNVRHVKVGAMGCPIGFCLVCSVPLVDIGLLSSAVGILIYIYNFV